MLKAQLKSSDKYCKPGKIQPFKKLLCRQVKYILKKKKILKGLEKVYERLIEFKKMKNSELVILRDNKIVKIKPE